MLKSQLFKCKRLHVLLALSALSLLFQNCTSGLGAGSVASMSSASSVSPSVAPSPTLAPSPAPASTLKAVTLTKLDSVPTGMVNGAQYFSYGTFQSFYQKTVQNQNGIFTAYLQSYKQNGGDGSNDVSVWVVKRSQDSGKTWSTIWTYTGTGTKTPCMETDSQANIFLAFPINQIHDAYFSKLPASTNYAGPITAFLANAGAGKYSCTYDEASGYFYLLGWTNLTRINVATMSTVDQRQMFVTGAHGQVEYPHIAFQADQPYLSIAWTTVTPTSVGFGNGGTPYADIRYAQSWDKGLTWGNPGVGNNLALPFLADDTGMTPRAVLDSDYATIAAATAASPAQNWLDSFYSIDGYYFFMYLHQSSGQFATRMVRYLASNQYAQMYASQLTGETLTINSNGAYLVTQQVMGGGHYIYAVGASPDQRIVVLISRDYGQSWHDWAQSAVLTRAPYATTGQRKVTSDGYIIGEFTDSPVSADSSSGISFFRIPAAAF